MNPLHRIYGLETEYPILFVPKKKGFQISHNLLYHTILDCLFREFRLSIKFLPSRNFKEGYFLSNGACLHYEVHIKHYHRGLLECSTPECVSPKEAVVYQFALDQMLKRVLPKVEKELAQQGFQGRVVIGKNNTDQKGNFYGCHENYLVTEALSFWQKIWAIFSLLFCFIVALPFFFVALLPLLFYFLVTSLFALLTFVFSFFQRLPLVGKGLKNLSGFVNRLELDIQNWIEKQNVLINYAYFIQNLLKPVILLYSYFLSFFLFKKYQKYLTGHLVSRQIYTGNGHIHIGEKKLSYEISQRAKSILKLFRVYWDDSCRPIYDIKEFIVHPHYLFHPQKRLHLTLGDSNLSLEANLLKLGTTGLIIAMIEQGHTFPKGELKNPIQALHQISEDPFLQKKLTLKNGEEVTPLELQHYYLEEAKAFYGNQKIQVREVNEILNLWEETLQALESQDYEYLGETLDYWMKKNMMDHALWGKPNWEDIGKALPILRALEKRLAPEGDFDWTKDMVRSLLSEKEWEEWNGILEKESYSWDFILECYEVYYQILHIDLQFHELSDEGLFFQFYQPTPMFKISKEEVEYAYSHPPGFTRAALRGKIVDKFGLSQSLVKVGWDGCTFIGPPTVHLTWDDPFRHSFTEKELEIIDG